VATAVQRNRGGAGKGGASAHDGLERENPISRKGKARYGIWSTLPRRVVQGHPVDNAENSNWNYTINPNRRLLSRLEDHDRNLPALRIALVELGSGIHRHELRPEAIALPVGRDASADLANHRANLNRGVRIRLEVMEPCWMRRLAGLRGHHDDGVAVFEVHHRRRPLHTALGARVVDQGYPGLGPAGDMSADPPAGAPIESHMELR